MRHVLTLVAVAVSGVAAVGASAETLLERGTYLMQGVVACGNCHTAPGGPFKDKELSGGNEELPLPQGVDLSSSA